MEINISQDKHDFYNVFSPSHPEEKKGTVRSKDETENPFHVLTLNEVLAMCCVNSQALFCEVPGFKKMVTEVP